MAEALDVWGLINSTYGDADADEDGNEDGQGDASQSPKPSKRQRLEKGVEPTVGGVGKKRPSLKGQKSVAKDVDDSTDNTSPKAFAKPNAKDRPKPASYLDNPFSLDLKPTKLVNSIPFTGTRIRKDTFKDLKDPWLDTENDQCRGDESDDDVAEFRQQRIEQASEARDRCALVKEWWESSRPKRRGNVPRKDPECRDEFTYLFADWLMKRDLLDALVHDRDEGDWTIYRYTRDPVVKVTDNWELAFHGTWWYALWSILESGVLLESTDRDMGHDYWEPGVYASPVLDTALWYARPQHVFHDGVFHRAVLELRVNPRKRRKSRDRGGVQWIFPPSAIHIVGVRIQINKPPKVGEFRQMEWEPRYECLPPGRTPPEITITSRGENNHWPDAPWEPGDGPQDDYDHWQGRGNNRKRGHQLYMQRSDGELSLRELMENPSHHKHKNQHMADDNMDDYFSDEDDPGRRSMRSPYESADYQQMAEERWNRDRRWKGKGAGKESPSRKSAKGGKGWIEERSDDVNGMFDAELLLDELTTAIAETQAVAISEPPAGSPKYPPGVPPEAMGGGIAASPSKASAAPPLEPGILEPGIVRESVHEILRSGTSKASAWSLPPSNGLPASLESAFANAKDEILHAHQEFMQHSKKRGKDKDKANCKAAAIASAPWAPLSVAPPASGSELVAIPQAILDASPQLANLAAEGLSIPFDTLVNLSPDAISAKPVENQAGPVAPGPLHIRPVCVPKATEDAATAGARIRAASLLVDKSSEFAGLASMPKVAAQKEYQKQAAPTAKPPPPSISGATTGNVDPLDEDKLFADIQRALETEAHLCRLEVETEEHLKKLGITKPEEDNATKKSNEADDTAEKSKKEDIVEKSKEAGEPEKKEPEKKEPEKKEPEKPEKDEAEEQRKLEFRKKFAFSLFS